MSRTQLKRFENCVPFRYIEHAKISVDNHVVVASDQKGKTQIQAGDYGVLLLGPGTSLTHAAIKQISANGSSIAWVGQGSVKTYAVGHGRSTTDRLASLQAKAWANSRTRVLVAKRLLKERLGKRLPGNDILKLQGLEGLFMRSLYEEWSQKTQVPWLGRKTAGVWEDLDPINRALSVAYSCLYGVCHAALATTGFLPQLGFIHTGDARSFVYDVADLYKWKIAVPVAFKCTKENPREKLEHRVRTRMEERALSNCFMKRIVRDVKSVLES